MTVLVLFVNILCRVLIFAIIIRAILSWFPLRPDNPLVVLIHQVTEPVLTPLRRIIPRMGVIDITPIIAIVLLELIYRLFQAFLSGG